ncbi:MAG: Uncharacterized protein Athens071426_547 [Parcubacteria group bacterium Athens0714_26]|nr:MAG: Uncharacterized protein Athens071426_547 [Parcubacteria group bacterium Athens0714_26]
MKKQSRNEDFFLEESIFDSWSSNNNLGSLELPLSRRAFILMLFLIVFSGLAVFSRVYFLASFKGDFYAARASANVGKEIYDLAPRGLIYDRNGKVLAENLPTFSVSVKPAELLSDSSGNEIKTLSAILEISEENIKNQLKNFNLENGSSLVLARNIDSSKIIQLKALNIEGMEIISDYKRYYPGEIFSSVIGYTTSENNNEIAGKTGLEAFYNDYLKGVDGKTVVYRDAKGNEIDKKILQSSKEGNNLETTIDAEFQTYFYNRFKQALNQLGRKSGVGIAINPKNGEILSLFSLPTFDNNIFSGSGNNDKKLSLLNSPDNPMFNRAVSGVYTPGSTIKPLVGMAVLKEGVIDPQKQIYSPGYLDVPNPYDPSHPSRFLDWRPQGWVDIHSALARSSNVYFYTVTGGFGDIKGLGIGKLKEYWQKFGLGKKTGIDLFGEKEGFLPDPAEKEQRKGDIWRIGDTYNVSIGQGDLMVTPIQLIGLIASIADGGNFYKPHLNKADAPKISIDYTNLANEIKEVKIGMEDAVSKSYGTAYQLVSLSVKAAAKTGSSQIANNTKTNAFFVGYEPADDPQIAVLVLIENAKEGSLNAVPIAKDVMEWYANNRILSGQQ